MKILNGIASGMVMQRNIESNLCDIHVQLVCVGEPRISQGILIQEKEGWYNLCQIPCGGPYSLIISDDEGEVRLEDIYVGDVWMLAGQSNMEGAGMMTEWEDTYEKNPETDVRAFYLDDHWDVARAQLHDQSKNADQAIAEYFTNLWKKICPDWNEESLGEPSRSGVGPGLFLGLGMKQYMGVPQGLIACAFGGASMEEWSPSNKAARAYYPSLIRRFLACGGNARGLFWYQGEGQPSEKYVEKMVELIGSLRRDTANPDLPVVLFQVASCSLPGCGTEDYGRVWSMMREKQRTLPEHIKLLDVVATIDLPRDDLIHLSAAAAHIVGARGARAMYALCGGAVLPAPQLESIIIEQDPVAHSLGNLIIQFKNLDGSLCAHGNVLGFSVALEERQAYTEPYGNVKSICLEGNRVRVRVEFTCEQLKEAYLWYGAGVNCICTITDGDNMSLPAMGPITVKEYLREKSS